MPKRTGLSKTQSIRYGGLVAVMCGRKPYDWLLNKLEEDNFVIIHMQSNSDAIILTEKGENEFNRLTRLAGLPSWQDIEKV
tara:strand:- start:577 stop:819 length:243 start_codon:yes stop_codon:yes gene_type:complete